MGKTALALIHATALVSDKAKIGKGARVWAFAQIREKASIGAGTMVGNGAYIDAGVRVGARCNIHNKALLYRNLIVEDDVFIGPGVCITNDPMPRANRIRNLRNSLSRVKSFASIGANATILPDLTIGRHAVVGAGAVVSSDVPDYGLVYGVPARLKGFVSPSGNWLSFRKIAGNKVYLADPARPSKTIIVKKEDYDRIEP